MKAAFFEMTEIWDRDIIRNQLNGIECIFFTSPIQDIDPKLYQDCEILSIFIYSKINREIILNLKSVKFIVTRSSGTNHIDLEVCNSRKIQVESVPKYGETSVAEYTVALLLALSKRIVESSLDVKLGNFSYERVQGFELNGKTLGIIGYGNIGKSVARIAKGFNMKVLVFDKSENSSEKVAQDGFVFEDFENLLKKSDILSLHVPLVKSTFHLLSEKEFSQMKDGIIIINTSRGELINSKDLLLALNSQKVKFAALDVIEDEAIYKESVEENHSKPRKDFSPPNTIGNLFYDHALISHKRVLVTPHNAFNSIESTIFITEKSNQKILDYLKNK